MENEKYYVARGRDNNQNSLKHWKYVKREKVNGKWRYYYDIKDALGYDEKERFDKAAANVASTKRGMDMAKDNYHAVQQHYVNKYYRGEYVDQATGALKDDIQPHYDEEVKNNVEPKYKAYKVKQAAYEKAGQEFCKAKTEYMKTPLGKIDNFTSKVKKGAEAVSKLFKKLFKR